MKTKTPEFYECIYCKKVCAMSENYPYCSRCKPKEVKQ
jgi:hypothetical protein